GNHHPHDHLGQRSPPRDWSYLVGQGAEILSLSSRISGRPPVAAGHAARAGTKAPVDGTRRGRPITDRGCMTARMLEITARHDRENGRAPSFTSAACPASRIHVWAISIKRSLLSGFDVISANLMHSSAFRLNSSGVLIFSTPRRLFLY